MKAKSFAVPLIVVGLAAGMGGAATAEGQGAAKAARTNVTIKAQGTHMSGTISSPKAKQCASGRTVLLMMQMGARGNDMQMGRATARRHGSGYTWSAAATGMTGRYYAVVKAKAGCKADSSPTIRAHR